LPLARAAGRGRSSPSATAREKSALLGAPSGASWAQRALVRAFLLVRRAPLAHLLFLARAGSALFLVTCAAKVRQSWIGWLSARCDTSLLPATACSSWGRELRARHACLGPQQYSSSSGSRGGEGDSSFQGHFRFYRDKRRLNNTARTARSSFTTQQELRMPPCLGRA